MFFFVFFLLFTGKLISKIWKRNRITFSLNVSQLDPILTIFLYFSQENAAPPAPVSNSALSYTMARSSVNVAPVTGSCWTGTVVSVSVLITLNTSSPPDESNLSQGRNRIVSMIPDQTTTRNNLRSSCSHLISSFHTKCETAHLLKRRFKI